MTEQSTLTRANLKTSRAAAIAGILFSVLLILVFWLLRVSVPDDPLEPGAWLNSQSGTVALALNLVPFAGIAFLWFIGVLRDRLGTREDQFFSTVFFGSGLLFLAMLFAAAAVAGALIISFTAAPAQLIKFGDFLFCTSRRLQHDERLYGQDGGRVHDHNLDDRDVHGVCTTMAGYSWLRLGDDSSLRQLLLELELRRIPIMGTSDEHLHLFG